MSAPHEPASRGPAPHHNGLGRPRRSVLYVPGSNERALTRAAELPSDGLILDLEESVAPDAKDAARERVEGLVSEGAFAGREVAIRVNLLDRSWFAADVEAVARARPDALLIPKVTSERDVAQAERALNAAGADPAIRIWAMLESAAAIHEARSIAKASDRLEVLVVGTNDLAKELRTGHVRGRAPLLTALSWCVLAAREAGKVILDGVFNDLTDVEGFEAECGQGRAFGFDGKTLVHPDQVAPCNRIFSPSEAELTRSRRIIAASEQARSRGIGVVTVDGRMVEQLHVDQARLLLAQAEAITSLEH